MGRSQQHYSRQTVAKGRRELLDKNVDFNRTRKEGAGRPRVETLAEKIFYFSLDTLKKPFQKKSVT